MFFIVLFLLLVCRVDAKVLTVTSNEEIPSNLKDIVAFRNNSIFIAPSSVTHRLKLPSNHLNSLVFGVSKADLSSETKNGCLSLSARPFELIFADQTNKLCHFKFTWLPNEYATKNMISVRKNEIDNTFEIFVRTNNLEDSVKIGIVPILPERKTVNDFDAIFQADESCFSTDFFTENSGTNLKNDERSLNVRLMDLNYPSCRWNVFFPELKLVTSTAEINKPSAQLPGCGSHYKGDMLIVIIGIVSTFAMLGIVATVLWKTRVNDQPSQKEVKQADSVHTIVNPVHEVEETLHP